MKFLRILFRRLPQTFPTPEIPVLIARRAMRLHNRDRVGASAYERVHAILGAGKCQR